MTVLATQDFQRAANRLGCSLAAIRAVSEVEAPRGAFDADGRPTTLFEGHWFYRFTQGKWATSHPTLCYPNWSKQFYGRTRDAEWQRLVQAQALDWDAACKATSWGRFQVMGFNHHIAGHPTLRGFVAAMGESEQAHLDAFVNVIEAWGLADELQRHDWTTFARIYNGPGYALNQYDVKMAAAHKRWTAA